ncbi:flagellar hook-length control protein FliK [Roseivivax sp. CAU 1761]
MPEAAPIRGAEPIGPGAPAAATAPGPAAPLPPAWRQVTEVIARRREGTTELRLAPEELGRLQLRLTPGEAGLAVTISAERPETLDMLRRHIGELARDLTEAGFGGLSFAFSGGDPDPPPRQAGCAPHPPGAAAAPPAPDPRPAAAAAEGLDLLL